MAFLVQKNDGRFTLRKWGDPWLYAVDPWLIISSPTKTYDQAQDQFFSSCVVNWLHNERTNDYGKKLVYNAEEKAIQRKYHKLKQASFDTRLTEETQALAKALTSDGSYLGRIALGRAVDLPTAISKEPGFHSTASPRTTLSGQVLPGAGGYTWRGVTLNVSYKINHTAWEDLRARSGPGGANPSCRERVDG
jgi:hypothetical protein